MWEEKGVNVIIGATCGKRRGVKCDNRGYMWRLM